MTIISDNPSFWPAIALDRSFSYYVVASSTMVVYDWALTFGQEVDLLWSQRWSFMTLLCLGMRYIGILYSADAIVENLPVISLTDMGCIISYQIQSSADAVVNVMLCVIMITRLHAMYQRSRKMLIFLIVLFLTLNIASGAIIVVFSIRILGEEYILSGTYQCSYWGIDLRLFSVIWILGIVWEVTALCLATWIAVKHFRELQQMPMTSAIGDCLTALTKSHMFYFISFATIALFNLSYIISPKLLNSPVFGGVVQIAEVIQMFLLGPRLILSVREYHAKLVENSDAGTGMTTLAFQAGIPASTDSSGDVSA